MSGESIISTMNTKHMIMKPKDVKYNILLILNKHISTLHDIKSSDDINTIVCAVVDIVTRIYNHEAGSFDVVVADLLKILETFADLSTETKVEIIRDICEYLIMKLCYRSAC
jgi:hypothetical protein